MKQIIPGIIIVIFVVILSTCKHEPTQIPLGNNPIDTNIIVTYDSVCFNTQILPLITSSCAQAGCHDPIKHEEDLILNSYSGIMKLGTDKLLIAVKLSSGKKMMPPLPQPRLDSTSINLIQRWINEGSKNRICIPSVCDTVNVKYATHIAPVLNTYCKGCHNAGNKGGNVNLDNYTDAKNNTIFGKVLCSVTATSGCALMPKGGPALSSCNIRKLQLWAAANCP
ncbi:MAG: hypothetical protein Q8M15_13670 [Bacteroidota bacterium]|nr:hypothetical protein [Bacteroidota bacterium]